MELVSQNLAETLPLQQLILQNLGAPFNTSGGEAPAEQAR